MKKTIYKIIKKKGDNPKFFIEIENPIHHLCFGYVGGYRGYDFYDSYDECFKNLQKLMKEDEIEMSENNRDREVVFQTQ